MTAPDAGSQPDSLSTPGSHDSVKVVYLGGIGRSGSTVLGRMLGSLDGVASLGEVVHLWTRGRRDDQLCGCGRAFSACPFWTAVGEDAFGSWNSVPVDDLIELQRTVDRNRFLPWLVSGRGPADYQVALSDFRSILTRLYQAASRVSGAEVLVDTSKNVPYGWLLRDTPGIDLRVVHLVRDSRGVAHSWAKTVVRPELTDETGYMDKVSTSKLSARWMFDNTMFEMLGRTSTSVERIRYEDVVAHPADVVRRITNFASFSADQPLLADLAAGEFTPTEQHEVSGNPMRFVDGPVRLRPDVGWRDNMPTRDRRIATMITAPLMARYHYFRD